MSSLKPSVWLCFLLFSTTARSEGFVLGGGVDGDSADGRAVSAFGDFGLADSLWLSAAATYAETTGVIRDSRIVLGSLSLDRFFDPLGVRIGGAYWGDPDLLDSRDLEVAFYLRGTGGFLSADYERRNFEFDLQSDLLRGRTAKFSADGWGLTSRIGLGKRVDLYAGGMTYDYSRNLRIQEDIALLDFISRSRLSMINSLIDDRVHVGLEFKFGLRRLDLNASRWQAALDGSYVDSYSVGFLAPVSDRLDAEIRFSVDESDTYGGTTALSLYFYYFGGA